MTYYLYGLAITKGMPSMGRGKQAAHAGAHAANKFTHQFYVKPLLDGKQPQDGVAEWHNEADGFGTTVILDAGTKNEMIDIVQAAMKAGIIGGIVKDPTYPYIVDDEILALIPPETHTAPPVAIKGGMNVCHRDEYTAGFLFGTKDELRRFVGHLNLLDNDVVKK